MCVYVKNTIDGLYEIEQKPDKQYFWQAYTIKKGLWSVKRSRGYFLSKKIELKFIVHKYNLSIIPSYNRKFEQFWRTTEGILSELFEFLLLSTVESRNYILRRNYYLIHYRRYILSYIWSRRR